MPNPTQVLTPAELQAAIEAWTPLRQVDAVHIHCTDHPRKSEWKGKASVEAMRKFHMSIGFSDIAQHLTADPTGLLWTGRPFDAMPASVRGHNGTSQAGPFMIEMVGLFDTGAEKLEKEQKAAVLAAVCAVLRKFKLDASAVKFHRELLPKPPTKTCPGTSLDPKSFRADVAEALGVEPKALQLRAVPKSLRRDLLDREALYGRGVAEDTRYAEVPEDRSSVEEIATLARWIDRGLLGVDGAAGREVKPEYRELLPYVINTSQGLLSKEGAMETHPEDIDALIEQHLTPAFDSRDPALPPCTHLMFYAHGGLNTEEGALDNAKTIVPWWRANGVYPIYFIWESSLFQAIFQRPRDLQRGAAARGELGDKVLEGLTQRLARPIWRRLKANARRCSSPDIDGQQGGLFQFWQKLEPWLKKHQGVQLHAIGHSTGPILLSKFMPLAIHAGFEFSTLTYLAPAIRIDDFKNEVLPLLGAGKGIRRLRQFTMNDQAERDDNVAKIYTKSLLYYVREAAEDDTDGRIVGLERDLYADKDLNPGDAMRTVFGLPAKPGVMEAHAGGAPGDPQTSIEFAQPRDAFPKNEHTKATAHGCFDNEEATMTHVLLNILGTGGGPATPDPHHPFPWHGTSACGGDDASRDLDEDWTAGLGRCCCCGGEGGGAAAAGSVDDDFDAPPPAGGGGPDVPDVPTPDRGGGQGRRVALCVGINAYPRQPLEGCVQDSKNWAAALRRNGFTVTEMHDAAATRANLVAALRKLIRDGRDGDQLVFQYSGHGSQVDDVSGDEDDRFDEVVVPVDFDQGNLLIDDDTYGLCKELPKGATLTFLMDCCHSGTNTRFAPVRRGRGSALPRFVRLNASEVERHTQKRAAMPSAPKVSERAPLPGVVSFAACRDDEVAWEEDGQGNFSRHALAVLDAVLARGGSNQAFHNAVVKDFGADKRQRPLLEEPAGGLDKAPFLGGR